MYWEHMSGWGWAMMVVWPLIAVGLLAAAFRVVGRRAGGDGAVRSPAGPTAREVLDARLARGEINVEAYERLRRALDE